MWCDILISEGVATDPKVCSLPHHSVSGTIRCSKRKKGKK